MPTYSYRCEKCQHSFDVFQKISEDPIRVCPKCQEISVRRVIHGGAGIIFKGSGFYCTDYKNKSSSSYSSTPIKADKTEKTSDTTSSTNETVKTA